MNGSRVELPILPIRGVTVFPNMVLNFDVGREKSILALEDAMVKEQRIFLASQKDPKTQEPDMGDMHQIGTIALIKQLLKLPGNTIRVLVEGEKRGVVKNVVRTEPYFTAEIDVYEEFEDNDINTEALVRVGAEVFEEYAKVVIGFTPETILTIISEERAGVMADLIIANSSLNNTVKQMALEEFDSCRRLEFTIAIINHDMQVHDIKRGIFLRTKTNIDKTQKEYFLREQLKVIQDELGDKDGIKADADDYRQKSNSMNLPFEVYEKIEKELSRFEKIPLVSPESAIVRNYIDWVLDLPWDVTTNDSNDLKKAEIILNKDHYGLEKVKERILEFLAVRMFAPKSATPILCFVGPPGVGKTSVARSIASALDRKFVRMSLGGVRDEAEIRGHRKTYIGAMPGRILNALKQAKSRNPLMLLDEIDKMGNDIKGDPASALLEVLDGEQNSTFRDHFIELPFDLSETLFICTANNVETIPPALKDRLEIITLSSYTEDEKINIAMNHLLDKQLKKHGLKKTQLKLNMEIIKEIINSYTREAGVRQLERLIGELCRKAVRLIVSGEKKQLAITPGSLERYLGTKKYKKYKIDDQSAIGVARGLAWTAYGGETLSIEVNIIQGTGKIELTGQMGDVMKESAKAALSYVRSQSEKFNIASEFYKEKDIHIHIPEGAVPKDGPSAGITMAAAIISSLTQRPIYNNVGMSGEITIRGRVLPVGGLKEKIIAGKRIGLKKIVLPSENKNDLDEISKEIKEDIEFTLVKDMGEVLAVALIESKQM